MFLTTKFVKKEQLATDEFCKNCVFLFILFTCPIRQVTDFIH